jgi:hypothetical protein
MRTHATGTLAPSIFRSVARGGDGAEERKADGPAQENRRPCGSRGASSRQLRGRRDHVREPWRQRAPRTAGQVPGTGSREREPGWSCSARTQQVASSSVAQLGKGAPPGPPSLIRDGAVTASKLAEGVEGFRAPRATRAIGARPARPASPPVATRASPPATSWSGSARSASTSTGRRSGMHRR